MVAVAVSRTVVVATVAKRPAGEAVLRKQQVQEVQAHASLHLRPTKRGRS